MLKPSNERGNLLSDAAQAAIEESIISGELRPLERLTEVELSNRLGASRAPVREALRMLERDGLVRRMGQSFVVADITLDEAEDIFECVAFIEDLYTRRATPFLKPDDIAKLHEALNDMQGVADTGDIAGYEQVNRRFHGIIQGACPNASIVDLVESVGKRTLRFRRFAMSIPDHLSRSVIDHKRIVDAIEAGDAKAAGKAASRAAQETFRRLAKALPFAGRI